MTSTAKHSMKDSDKKKRILFVCLGNICRSVTAEEIFKTMAETKGLGKDIEADSAGLIDYHQGELADSRMRNCAFKHGYKLTHRSRPVVDSDFETFDLIVGMDDNNISALNRRCPAIHRHKIVPMAQYLTQHSNSFIPDPYYGGMSDFELVVALLEDACSELIRRLQNAK